MRITAAHFVWLVCDWIESLRDALVACAMPVRSVYMIEAAIQLERSRGYLLVQAGRLAEL